MHTFYVKKRSLVVDDVELIDDEIRFASDLHIKIRALLSQEFWGNVRSFGISYEPKVPGQVEIAIILQLLLSSAKGHIKLVFDAMIFDRPDMADIVASTAPQYIEALLHEYVRETGKDKADIHRLIRTMHM